MAAERGVLSFCPNGLVVRRKKNTLWRSIPTRLEEEFKKASDIYCVAIGPNDNFISTYKTTKGKTFQFRQLDKYPVLESYLAGKFKEEKIKYDSMHVSLGPNGSFYINSSVGQHQNGLDPKLQKELDGRLTPEGLWPWDPAQVALGVEGSYVLVGKKGDIMWDLKGHYASLETKLQEAKLGVKSVALSPFSGTFWFVMWSDTSYTWTVDDGWDGDIKLHE